MGIVRQVGHLQDLYRDARSTEHKREKRNSYNNTAGKSNGKVRWLYIQHMYENKVWVGISKAGHSMWIGLIRLSERNLYAWENWATLGARNFYQLSGVSHPQDFQEESDPRTKLIN
jgi:hypothetical protein